MLSKVIAKIKTGSIKTVIPYGYARPAPPYVVVRTSADPLGRGKIFRIFWHFSQGGQALLDDYDGEIISLLDGFNADSRKGNNNQLEVEPDYDDITINNDDDTISRERRFLMPSRTF